MCIYRKTLGNSNLTASSGQSNLVVVLIQGQGVRVSFQAYPQRDCGGVLHGIGHPAAVASSPADSTTVI